jgi:hypothetical protein
MSGRERMRLWVLVAAALAVLSGEARAEGARERGVKLVVHGGSVSAFRHGGYGQWLPAACSNVHVDNIAREKLGSRELRIRFAEMLRSGRLHPKRQESWLVYLGGMNSLGSTESTNFEIASTFKLAHEAGFRTMGLTITPWGSERDGRWRGASGLEWFAKTQQAVDFVMGRLSPAEAFGSRASNQSDYLPGQLPDIAVDLWDFSLRDRAASSRPTEAVERLVRSSSWVRSQLAGLEGEARESALDAWVHRAAALPQWFLRAELIGSDPVHPNSQGHKQIAEAVCSKAPPSWSCDCSAFDGLTWDPGKRKPVPSR